MPVIFVGELEHDKCRSFLGAVSAIQKNVIESAGGELLIGHGRRAQPALDAAQFHSEDMDDETANVFGACDVDSHPAHRSLAQRTRASGGSQRRCSPSLPEN